MKSTYYYHPTLGHSIECNGDTTYHFELCNTPENGRQIWGYDNPIWMMDRIQRRSEACDKIEPFYVSH